MFTWQTPNRRRFFKSFLDGLSGNRQKRSSRRAAASVPQPAIEFLEDRCMLAAAALVIGELVYAASPGETNNIVLSPGDYFSIQDADDVVQFGLGGCVPSDFLAGIGIDIGTSIGGSIGTVVEADWDVGIGIGFPVFGYKLPDGVICPSPIGMMSARDIGDSVQDTFSRLTEGVSSVVAGAEVTEEDTVFYKVSASNGTVDEYILFQAVVDPAAGLSESEDNDTVSQADTVTTSTLVTGELETTDDVDWFKFQFAPGPARAFAVILDNDPDNDDEYTNTSISLYDSYGNELGSNVSFSDGHAIGGVEVASSIYPTTYYLAVAGNGFGDDTDYQFVVTEATSEVDEDQPKIVEVTESPNQTIPDYDAGNPTNELVSSMTVDLGNSFAHPTDVQVTLNINHSFDADLDVYLESPSGIIVELFTDVGGSGDDFADTVLSDSAATMINAGAPFAVAPFTGTYQPEGNLSDFAHSPMTGEWRLHVRDDTAGDQGTLVDWTMTFTVDNNDSADMADSLGLNQSADGAVPSNADRDFFKVDDASIAPGDLVFAYVDTHDTDHEDPDDLDSYLTVYSADGTTVLGEDDDDGPALSTHNFNQVMDDFGDMGLDLWSLSGSFAGPLIVDAQDGNDTVDASKLNLIAQDTQIFGGSGRDTILGPGGDRVMLDGGTGADTFVFNNSAAAILNLSGGDGMDTLLVNGTDGNDVIGVQMDGADLLVSVNGVVARYTDFANSSIEVLIVAAGDGDDAITIDHTNGDIVVSGGISVSGDASADQLLIVDNKPGRLVVMRQGPDERTGSVTIGSLEALGYDGIEQLDFEPFDPITSTTGTDQGGRIVVFDEDPFEFNDTRLNATDLHALGAADFNPNIDAASDEDWYLFKATKIGTFRLDAFFEPIAELPGGGNLNIELYNAAGTLIAAGVATADCEQVTFSTAEDQDYYLRVRGATFDAINVYDVSLTEVDVLGPQLYDPDGAAGVNAVHITDDVGTARDESLYDLFDPKPATDGTTPVVNSLTIHVRDLLTRDLTNRASEDADVYPALDPTVAAEPGHYRLVGDHVGVIPISSVTVINDPAQAGQMATGSIVLNFSEPLPDDRFTLTVSDAVTDPAGNRLDGDSNAAEPQGTLDVPTGDGLAGGDFVARFTIDSHPEIGVVGQGSISVDINGDHIFSPSTGDAVNRDFVFHFGLETDAIFAGQFCDTAATTNDGFDRLGSYGLVGGTYRWLLDFNNDGVPEVNTPSLLQLNAIPFAGNFDQTHPGDEIGFFTGTTWYFDTNGDNNISDADVSLTGDLQGQPIVGDFDGDGLDDLATHLSSATSDMFYFDLTSADDGTPGVRDGYVDATIAFGFPGVLERPFAADFNQDGIDDIGLKVPCQEGNTPADTAEWYFLISDAAAASAGTVGALNHSYSPSPIGNDLFAQFGANSGLPLVGNFDPPASTAGTNTEVEHETETLGLYNPTDSQFYLKNSHSGGEADVSYGYGPAGGNWQPVSGDWDGDGITTLGLYNSVDSVFYLKNSHSGGTADVLYGYGPAGANWQPVSGDWNGDGVDTLALYNSVDSVFYLKNSHSGGTADVLYGYGPAGANWQPVSGDWDGDGIDTLGLYDPETSQFFLKNSHSGGAADVVFAYGPAGSNWEPIAGDWDSDGIDTVGLYDPAMSQFFLRNSHNGGVADVVFAYGAAGANWTPVAGCWINSSALQLSASPLSPVSSDDLTQTDLKPIVETAIALWADAGISASQAEQLSSVTVTIADLPGTYLGVVDAGTIVLDIDAAGYGWHTGAAPQQPGDDSDSALKVDLLTVVAHEFGHVLDLGHDMSDDVMQPLLPPGVRRLPGPEEIDAAFASEWNDYLQE